MSESLKKEIESQRNHLSNLEKSYDMCRYLGSIEKLKKELKELIKELDDDCRLKISCQCLWIESHQENVVAKLNDIKSHFIKK